MNGIFLNRQGSALPSIFANLNMVIFGVTLMYMGLSGFEICF